ncbi:hypothetical protein TNCV_2337931 [Trichonephila clavipes]|nr:hypothetical protein TNCV_2337931 [Trichonephila clavipes]
MDRKTSLSILDDRPDRSLSWRLKSPETKFAKPSLKSGQRLLSLFVTFLLCLEEECPGKHSTAVLQRLAFMSGVQSGASL